MGASMTTGSMPDFYAGLLANLDYFTWMKYNIPIEMRSLFNARKGHGPFINTTTVSGLGAVPVKTEDQPTSYGQFYQGFDKKFTPVTYSLGYSVSKEAVDRNEYFKIANSAKALDRSFKATEEVYLATPINTGFDAMTTADGKYVFATDHLSEGPGVGSRKNTLSTAADLSVVSYQLAINDYMSLTDGRGLLLDLRPGRLVVPPENAWLAYEVTKSQGRSDTANRADNAFLMNPFTKGIEVQIYRYLTDADGWGLWPASNDDHDLAIYEWEAFNTSACVDFDTDALKYKGRKGYTFGAAMFEGIFYVQGA